MHDDDDDYHGGGDNYDDVARDNFAADYADIFAIIDAADYHTRYHAAFNYFPSYHVTLHQCADNRCTEPHYHLDLVGNVSATGPADDSTRDDTRDDTRD